MQDISVLEQQLGHSFKDPNLLKRALRHRSMGSCHNERLEFLGDAVLDAVVAKALYLNHPDAKEGLLSRMRSSLVSGEALSRMASSLGLTAFICVGSGEPTKIRPSIAADALESVVAAIFLDAGYEVVARCIHSWFQDAFATAATDDVHKDAKTVLQEALQAKHFPLPVYTLLTKEGKPHQQRFTFSCHVQGLPLKAQATAASRRKAEQAAAKDFLKAWLAYDEAEDGHD